MIRRHLGRSGLCAVLSMGLLELGGAACGGQTGEDGAGDGVSGSLGGSSSNESGAGGAAAGEPSAPAGGRATGGVTGTAGEGDGGAVTATGGAPAGGGGGDVTLAGGTTEPSSGGGTVGATGGSDAGGGDAGGGDAGGGPPAGGGAPQAGEASAAGGSATGGDGAAAGAATASGGGGGVDCALVGCGLSWCGEECQSPCGCCPCLEGSVDAEGNRCADGCWLRTAGDVHCQEPWDAGPCDAEVPVFWFDAATNRCEPRTYGGCQGNANRFDTLAFCEQDCAEIRGPTSAPLPVVYAFGDGCSGNALSADGRRIVTEFVAEQPHDPPGDEPYVRVDLMAGNELCARMSDVVLNGAGVEAFVDYYEYGARGYLPVHEAEVPVAAITLDLGELSVALGVEPPDVEWR